MKVTIAELVTAVLALVLGAGMRRDHGPDVTSVESVHEWCVEDRMATVAMTVTGWGCPVSKRFSGLTRAASSGATDGMVGVYVRLLGTDLRRSPVMPPGAAASALGFREG